MMRAVLIVALTLCVACAPRPVSISQPITCTTDMECELMTGESIDLSGFHAPEEKAP